MTAPPPMMRKFPVARVFEDLAAKYEIAIIYGDFPAAAFRHDGVAPLAIFVPERYGGLRRAWAIAHEMGHILHGHGFLFDLRPHHESEADAWAAREMVPDRGTDPGLPLWEHHGQESPPSGGTKLLSKKIIELSRNM